MLVEGILGLIILVAEGAFLLAIIVSGIAMLVIYSRLTVESQQREKNKAILRLGTGLVLTGITLIITTLLPFGWWLGEGAISLL